MTQRTPVCEGRHRAGLVLTGIVLITLAGCGPRSVGTDVVAVFDDTEIHYREFEAYQRDNVGASDLPLEDAVLNQLFDQFVDERLLIRLARERGFQPAEGGESAAEPDPTYQRRHLRDALGYLLRLAQPSPVRDAEVAAYYEARREEYSRRESVRLNQILVHDQDDAAAALAALRSGEDFDSVAARFSQVPMAHLGDADGRLTREDLPVAFADSIFDLEPGEVSEVFPADYGFHLFQVVEKFPKEEVPFEAVEAEIRRTLERRRLDETASGFVDEARQRYNVRVHLDNFPFDYRGFYAQ